jgi:hypothetical protein
MTLATPPYLPTHPPALHSDWDAMEKEGYRWFRRRMAHMAQYFQVRGQFILIQ